MTSSVLAPATQVEAAAAAASAHLEEWIAAVPRSPQPIDESIAQASIDRAGTTTSMASRAWTSACFQWCRATEIRNPAKSLYIANIAAFPHLDSPSPMIQIEIVVLKGQAFLVVLDAFAAARGDDPEFHSSRAFLGALAARSNLLPPVAERSEWGGHVVSPHAIWSKPMASEAIAQAVDGMGELLRWAASIERQLDGVSEPSSRGERRDAIAAMRDECLADCPSKPFLKAQWGEEWTQRFMDGFFFPKLLIED